MDSHTKHTLYTVAKAGYLQGCPGLTPEAINKYISVEDATEMGHMQATPAGKQSTTKKRGSSKASLQFEAERKETEADATATPEQEPKNQKTKYVYMTVKLVDSFIASDHTGAYPRASSRGNKYICVFYIFDPNYIKGKPIKSRHSSELLKAYREVYQWCESRGFKPILHCMDNETSKEVENFIQSQQTDLQYSPPGCHC